MNLVSVRRSFHIGVPKFVTVLNGLLHGTVKWISYDSYSCFNMGLYFLNTVQLFFPDFVNQLSRNDFLKNYVSNKNGRINMLLRFIV
jgi:hypothetical protein